MAHPNYLAVLQALSQLPQPGRPSPLTPTFIPPMEPPESVMFPTPEPPPPAPSAPIDRRIIEQYLALLGPAPTPPPAQAPVGTLEKIATVLSGINAGFQGQGPQFAGAIRAERERPQREFEAKQDRYNQQRTQFGLHGLDSAQRAEDRRQERAQREADRRFELEVSERARQLNFKDQTAIEKLRDAMQTERLKEQERIADEKQQEAFKNQQRVNARQFASAYRKEGATDRIAKELGDYDANLTDTLSPAAAKWQSAQVQRALALTARAGRGAGGGGGTGGGKVQSWIEFTNGDIIEADKVNFDRMPAGVQVKRAFSTVGGQPIGGAGGATGANVEQELRGFITTEQTAKTPPAQIAQKLRSAPGYAANKELAERLIKELGLVGEKKPLLGWTDLKTGVTTPMFTYKPFTAPGAKTRETGASIRGK